MTLPFAVPMAAMFNYGRVDFFLVYSPQTHIVPMLRYFWDNEWSWVGKEWVGLSLQIDSGLLLAFIGMLITFAWRHGTDAQDTLRVAWSITLLTLVIIIMMALQTRAALVVFEWLPGARYIQFPWRLLLFVSISLVLCAAILLNQVRLIHSPRLAIALGLALMVSTLANKPWWVGMPRPWFSPAEVAAALHSTYDSDPPEYFPRMTGVASNPWPGWGPAAQALRDLRQRFPYTCQVTLLDNLDGERAKARISVSCATSGTAALPAFLVRGLRVEANRVPIVASRSCQDPRALVELPAGTSLLTLRFPTWWSVMAALVSGTKVLDISRCASGDA